jgi:hypothetical protein
MGYHMLQQLWALLRVEIKSRTDCGPVGLKWIVYAGMKK